MLAIDCHLKDDIVVVCESFAMMFKPIVKKNTPSSSRSENRQHVSNGYPQDGFLPTFNSSPSGIKEFSYVVPLAGQKFSRK